MREVDDIIRSFTGLEARQCLKKLDELPYEEYCLLEEEYHGSPDTRFSDSLLLALAYATAPWQPDPIYQSQYAYACGYRD